MLENQTLRTKINYQFTRALSARVIVQYDSTLVDPAETSLSRTKQVSSSALRPGCPTPERPSISVITTSWRTSTERSAAGGPKAHVTRPMQFCRARPSICRTAASSSSRRRTCCGSNKGSLFKPKRSRRPSIPASSAKSVGRPSRLAGTEPDARPVARRRCGHRVEARPARLFHAQPARNR